MDSWSAITEQDTCRTFVVPALRASGWDKRQIREQYRITNGKIIASARRHRPGNPLVADYVGTFRPPAGRARGRLVDRTGMPYTPWSSTMSPRLPRSDPRQG